MIRYERSNREELAPQIVDQLNGMILWLAKQVRTSGNRTFENNFSCPSDLSARFLSLRVARQ